MFESLGGSLVVFAIATPAIVAAGIFIASVADELADRTGLGEAVVGGLFLAAATSLPDFAVTLTAATDGYPELAMSNIMGSMAVNVMFLGVGDLFYRKANLEHAAASSANLLQSALFIALMALPLIAINMPSFEVWGVHPVSPLLLVAYVVGYIAVRAAHEDPMWTPRRTAQTVVDTVDTSAAGDSRGTLWVWVKFAFLSAVMFVSGWALMKSGEGIAIHTPLSEGAVGGLITGVVTSLPELVTTIAAIRLGALTLAVGGILGTNCFNMTVVAAADFAYRDGSIYHAVAPLQTLWGLVTILMVAILLMGSISRERYGIARIGLESTLVLVIYLGAATFFALY